MTSPPVPRPGTPPPPFCCTPPLSSGGGADPEGSSGEARAAEDTDWLELDDGALLPVPDSDGAGGRVASGGAGD